MMKENDWIVAGLTNPDYSTSDFLISGVNLDNTQMMSPDYYKKSPLIKEQFSQNGVFDEQAFDTYYKKRATEFENLQTMDVQDNFLYSPFDPRAIIGNKKTKDPKFKFDAIANPTRDTVMLTGATYSDPYSMRERAQQNHIFDTATGTWSQDTLNDRTLVKNPLKWVETILHDPLVYATYDEDGEHYDIFSGRMIPHKKGQYKLNQYGMPYTETLSGRSLVGKEVVSAGDILTIDKQGLDKYNFFDSDDLEKSVGGTIMKSVAAIAPMLIPYVRPIYSGILVGRELLKTLPMLYGMTTAWFDTPPENEVLNKLAGYGEAFTGSTSDYGRSKLFNAEVITSLFTDVALQWGQQKIIANSIAKLRGSQNLMGQAQVRAKLYYDFERAHLDKLLKEEKITQQAFKAAVGEDATKWVESAVGAKALQKFTQEVEPIVKRANRLGADTSLVYMALVSNTDVYSSMLEHGTSRQEAAAVALGSTIGMFGVDRFLGLGELFFDNLTTNTQRAMRATINKEAQSWYKNVVKQTVQDPKLSTLEKTKRLFKDGIIFGQKSTNKFIDNLKYHSLGFRGKALGEGLEEVSEEIVTDISKGIYELLGAMGVNTTVEDVGAWDDMLPRYGMSFLGGTIGGGLFYGVDVYNNGTFNVDHTQEELIYLVRNGKTNEVLKMLDNWRKKGKLGSKTLSTRVVKGENDQDIFQTAESEADSQNEFIYNRIKETILSLDSIINEEGGKLNEDELFEKMVLSEVRFQKLKSELGELSYTTGYQQDYQNALSNVINLKGALQRANRTITGIAYETEEEQQKHAVTDEKLRHMTEQEKSDRNKNLKKIQDQLKAAEDHLNNFLSGQYSLEYSRKMQFAIDQSLNSNYIALNYEQWLAKYHNGKTINDLTPAEAQKYKGEWLEYTKNHLNREISERYASFRAIEDKWIQHLQEVADNQENFLKYQDEIQRLINDENSPLFSIKIYDYDDILDFNGETEESNSYKFRDNPIVRAEREEKILQHNLNAVEAQRLAILNIIEKSGGFIDPLLRRDLKLISMNRNKDILKNIRQNLLVDLARGRSKVNLETQEIIERGKNTELDNGIMELLSVLDPSNLENANEVFESIKQLIINDRKSKVLSNNARIRALSSYLSETPFGENRIFAEESISGTSIQEAIEELIPNPDEVDEKLNIGNTSLFDSDNYEDYDLSESQLRSFVEEVSKAYREGTLENFNEEIIDIDAVEESKDTKKLIEEYRKVFEDYLAQISQNPLIKLNNELDAKVKDINPVTQLIKNLGLSLNTDMNNLEQILEKLDSQYDEINDFNDIVLTAEEKESLEEAKVILQLAQAYLNAASNSPNILAPFGRNAAINEFAEKHKDIYKDFNPLPVLSHDVAAMYNMEISRYLRQIGVIDPKTDKYNLGSWLWLSDRNEGDKRRQHVLAGQHWYKAFYDFFANNREAFKFKYNSKNHDLLEGFESISPVTEESTDGLIQANKISDILHGEIDKLIKEGWTYNDIWERSGTLDAIATAPNNTLMDQITCTIDKDLKEEHFSLYDKAMLTITAAAINSTNFYAELNSRIDEDKEIVPLTIQEWLTKMAIAFIDNPDIYNESLQFLAKHPDNLKAKKIFVPYIMYLPGDAGGGKSRAIGRNVAKHVADNKLWLSAPTDTQIETLSKATGKGIKHLNRDKSSNDDTNTLVDALGIDRKAYDAALNELKTKSAQLSDGSYTSEYFEINENDEIKTPIPKLDKFGIKKMDNAPEVIIIDEATHLSALDIQLYGEYGRLNGTRFILLGDNKQRGFSGFGRNIDREGLFIARTQELGITLRDNNVQHQYNLNVLKGYISTLNKIGISSTDTTVVESIRANLKNLRFKAYNQEIVNGDLIVDSLTEDVAKKLKGIVGYVGGDNATYQMLKNTLGENNVVKMSEDNIQGQEFEYVVIDKKFDYPTNASAVGLLEFLQDLYTMVSRGMSASIIVDSTHTLRGYIGNNRIEFTKAKASSILDYADEFVTNTKKLYDRILEGVKQTTPTTSTTSATTTSTTGTISSTTNTVIPITSVNDFKIEDLNFDENAYGVVQIPENYPHEVKDDLKINQDQVLLATTIDDINAVIDVMEKGEASGGAQAFVLVKFPKSEFKEDGYPIDMTSIVKKLDKDNDLIVIPTKYIESVVEVPQTQMKEDNKTHKEDIEEVPVLEKEVIDQIIINESDILGKQEDYPSDPLLAYGNITTTGLDLEVRDGRQIWHMPKFDPTGYVLGESKLKNGALPVIKSYKEDDNGIIRIEFGSKNKNGISSKSQITTNIDNVVEDDDGKWLRENAKDTEFIVNKLSIHPDGKIYAEFQDTIEFKDGDIGGFSATWLKKLPFKMPIIKRDMQLFTTKADIEDDATQQDLTLKLRTLKAAFLHNHTYDECPDYIKNIMPKEVFEKLRNSDASEDARWLIEVRPKNDQDNLIRNTGMTEVTPIQDDLIFTVVGEFKMRNGNTGRITLGMMSNPDTWIEAIRSGKIEKELKPKIRKFKSILNNPKQVLTDVQRTAIEAKIKHWEDYLSSLKLNDDNSAPNRYKSFIQQLAGMYNGEPVVIPIARVITPGLTDLIQNPSGIVRLSRRTDAMITNIDQMIAKLQNEALTKVVGNAIMTKRVKASIKSLENKKAKLQKIREGSFFSKNPHATVSPMSIYTPTNSKLNIDDSVIGRYNVMHVTSDPFLSESDLIELYAAQKDAAEAQRLAKGYLDLKESTSQHSVRCLVLNPIGVSFQDLSNPYLRESMTSTVKVKKKNGQIVERINIFPFKTNFMGARMYVALWNFRANLLTFSDYLTNFVNNTLSTLGVNKDNLDTYLRVKELLYKKNQGEALDEEDKAYLTQQGELANFTEVSKAIDEFNESLADKVKQFRLGSGLENGAYVRQLTGNLKTFYDTDESINGIYLDSETLGKYITIAESIFSDVLDHIVTCDFTQRNGDKKKIEAGKRQLLSPKKSGVKNSFAYHLTTLANQDGVIEIENDPSNPEGVIAINFGSSFDPELSRGILNTFSHIPAVLSQVFKYTSMRQTHASSSSFDVEHKFGIRLTGTVTENGQEVKKNIPIPYTGLWEHIRMLDVHEEDNEAIDNFVFDDSLSNFFSFAFHGTLEDVNQDSPIRASDALFPNGFYADPMSSLTEKKGNGMFTPSIQQTIFWGSDVNIGDPTFFILLNDLQEAINSKINPAPAPTNDEVRQQAINLINEVTAKCANNPKILGELEALLQEVQSSTDSNIYEQVQQDIRVAIDKEIKKAENIFKKKGNIDLNTIKWRDGNMPITIGERVAQKFKELRGEELPPISQMKGDGTVIAVVAGDYLIDVRDTSGNDIDIAIKAAPKADNNAVNNEVSTLFDFLADNGVAERILKPIRDTLKRFNSASDEKQDKERDMLITKLEKLANQRAPLRSKILETVSKIKIPNC